MSYRDAILQLKVMKNFANENGFHDYGDAIEEIEKSIDALQEFTCGAINQKHHESNKAIDRTIERNAARKMAGEQWQRALKAELKIDGLKTYTIELHEEIAELQMECDRESDHALDAEKGGQYYLTVLKKVADWFGERDLPCPICNQRICTPECELKSVLGDLL